MIFTALTTRQWGVIELDILAHSFPSTWLSQAVTTVVGPVGNQTGKGIFHQYRHDEAHTLTNGLTRERSENLNLSRSW